MNRAIHLDLCIKLQGLAEFWRVISIYYTATLFSLTLIYTEVNIEVGEKKPVLTLIMWQSYTFRKRTQELSESNV